MIERIKEQCALSIDDFRRMMPIKWTERSILLSEAFAFCAVMDLCKVETVVESGVYNARSTVIWANYQGKRRTVAAFDKKVRKEAVDCLRGYHNVSLKEGDGIILAADFIRSRSNDHRCGVFIDGPKGEDAVRLAKECLQYPAARFVAVHDCYRNHKARKLMEEAGAVFFTDAEWFENEYSYLDAYESQIDNEQGYKWIPGGLVSTKGERNRIFGSYGPTMGFLVKKSSVE